MLQKVSILALCKFMTVSETVCTQNLQLVFDLLSSETCPTDVKKNIIVAMGDFLKRYTNLMTDQRIRLFDILSDKETSVRKCALLVLAQQILGDMLKLDGEIVDICLLLTDDSAEIRTLAESLLQALHKKDAKFTFSKFLQAFNRLSTKFAWIKREDFCEVAHKLMRNIVGDKH